MDKVSDLRSKRLWRYGGSRRTLLGFAIVIVIVMIVYLIMRRLGGRGSSRGRRKIRERATGFCSDGGGRTRSLCTHIVTRSLGVGVRVLGSSWLTCVVCWVVWRDWYSCFRVYLSVHWLLSEWLWSELSPRWWWRELIVVGIVGTT